MSKTIQFTIPPDVNPPIWWFDQSPQKTWIALETGFTTLNNEANQVYIHRLAELETSAKNNEDKLRASFLTQIDELKTKHAQQIEEVIQQERNESNKTYNIYEKNIQQLMQTKEKDIALAIERYAIRNNKQIEDLLSEQTRLRNQLASEQAKMQDQLTAKSKEMQDQLTAKLKELRDLGVSHEETKQLAAAQLAKIEALQTKLKSRDDEIKKQADLVAEKLLGPLREEIEPITQLYNAGSAQKNGEVGEDWIQSQLVEQLPGIDVIDTSRRGKSGDMQLTYQETTLAVEVKNADKVPSSQADDFRQVVDSLVSKGKVHGGVMFSIKCNIGGKGSFKVETDSDIPMVYVRVIRPDIIGAAITVAINTCRVMVQMQKLRDSKDATHIALVSDVTLLLSTLVDSLNKHFDSLGRSKEMLNTMQDSIRSTETYITETLIRINTLMERFPEVKTKINPIAILTKPCNSSKLTAEEFAKCVNLYKKGEKLTRASVGRVLGLEQTQVSNRVSLKTLVADIKKFVASSTESESSSSSSESESESDDEGYQLSKKNISNIIKKYGKSLTLEQWQEALSCSKSTVYKRGGPKKLNAQLIS